MQALREELQRKDEESLKKRREYKARIQEVEAQIQNLGKEHPGLDDEDIRSMSPATLTQKPKEHRNLDIRNGVGLRGGWHGVTFQNENQTPDVEMDDSDGDRRDAGTASYEPVSPRAVGL